ncbi:MAG: DUF393 domain-containing protein [Planctomycetota bacterium]|nr:DUF393 domain-containing protein [Planctomycetota bacterium]
MSISQSPSEAKPVIVYDGECSFCIKQMDRFRKRDSAGMYEYTPRQEPGLEDRFPGLAQGDFDTGMRLVRPDGTILVGADAVHGIARTLPPWKWAAWLYHIPGLKWLFRSLYGWIAMNRQRLGGSCETEACVLPKADKSKN